MSGAALNKGKIWCHKPILTRKNSLWFSVPAILEMLSIMVTVVCKREGRNVRGVPFTKFLQSHFAQLTPAVVYPAINKAWLLLCPVYLYHPLIKSFLMHRYWWSFQKPKLSPVLWLLLTGRELQLLPTTSVTTLSAGDHGHCSTSWKGREFIFLYHLHI